MDRFQIFDNKICQSHPADDGSVQKWRPSFKMRSYIGGLTPKLNRMVKIVECDQTRIDTHEGWEIEQVQLDFMLYQMLTSFLEGDGLNVLESVEEG